MPAQLQVQCVRALPPLLREALEKIAELMDAEVFVPHYDGVWANFSIPQLASGLMLVELEQRWKAAKLYDPRLKRLQILCPWGPYGQRGLFLRELSQSDQETYRAGFWYW